MVKINVGCLVGLIAIFILRLLIISIFLFSFLSIFQTLVNCSRMSIIFLDVYGEEHAVHVCLLSDDSKLPAVITHLCGTAV